MPDTRVTVVIPTLSAGPRLAACLEALAAQSLREFDVVVVDNSGEGRARPLTAVAPATRLLENPRNRGFGGAVNQGIRDSVSPFVATINDDTVPEPEFLAELVTAMERNPRAGICAPCVLLMDGGLLDSAGMLLAADCSSRQRGHSEPPLRFREPDEILLASGSAVLYRRAMLDEIGGFDEAFFMYCEDTDLSLRAQWAGWQAFYVPTAIIRHAWSASAGRGSALKAMYVERNRLFTAVKNLPARALWKVPFYAAARYFWHLEHLRRGAGEAARFQRSGGSVWQLAWYVVRAHAALVAALPRLIRQRRRIRESARVSSAEMLAKLKRHSVGIRQVAEW